MVEVTGASAEAISALGMAAKREGVARERYGRGQSLHQVHGRGPGGRPGSLEIPVRSGPQRQGSGGRDLDQQLIVLANAFETFSDEGQSGLNKTAVAMKVFGKQSENMHQVLQRPVARVSPN